MQLYQKLGNIFPFAENVPPAAKTHHIDKEQQISTKQISSCPSNFCTYSKSEMVDLPQNFAQIFSRWNHEPKTIASSKTFWKFLFSIFFAYVPLVSLSLLYDNRDNISSPHLLLLGRYSSGVAVAVVLPLHQQQQRLSSEWAGKLLNNPARFWMSFS